MVVAAALLHDIRVRRWDDEAKVPGAPTMELDELVDLSLSAGVEKTGAEK